MPDQGMPEEQGLDLAGFDPYAVRLELGVRPAQVLKDAVGAAPGPRGTVGSMTHCLGYRAAAAARADEITALGIDAEPHQPFPLTHRRLDFRTASVSFQPAERTFSAEFLVPGPRIGEDEVSRFHGRWLVDQGIVLTAIALLPARPNLRQVAR
ncbi:hypothetical protein [Streptomyces sp. IMTB 1903]|uniref:hypothetical protein n=1 Tax=Streptomyces sp. IMTB 1903 TaxID=1776680 RepID=UPI001F3BA89B|nr:hypothetical protein [Streptomyces sp. IMTB 1903]